MTTEDLPLKKPLCLKISKGTETEQFGAGKRKTFKAQTNAPAHAGDLCWANVNHH